MPSYRPAKVKGNLVSMQAVVRVRPYKDISRIFRERFDNPRAEDRAKRTVRARAEKWAVALEDDLREMKNTLRVSLVRLAENQVKRGEPFGKDQREMLADIQISHGHLVCGKITQDDVSDLSRDQVAMIAEALDFDHKMGRIGQPPVLHSLSIGDCIGLYLGSKKFQGLSKLSQDSYRQHLDWWGKQGNWLLDDLHKKMISDVVERLDLAASTKDRYVASLSAVISFVSDEGLFQGENPCHGIVSKSNVQTRERWATEKDIQRLLDVCQDEGISLYILLGALHGFRWSEVKKMRIENIEFDDFDSGVAGYFHLQPEQCKGSKGRSVPIDPAIVSSLKAKIGGRSDGPLFPGKKAEFADMSRRWYKVLEDSKLNDGDHDEPFVFHSLRHGAATRWVNGDENGEGCIALPVVQEILGHSKVEQTMEYVTTDSSHKERGIMKGNRGLNLRFSS